jgi:hypothetical protein
LSWSVFQQNRAPARRSASPDGGHALNEHSGAIFWTSESSSELHIRSNSTRDCGLVVNANGPSWHRICFKEIELYSTRKEQPMKIAKSIIHPAIDPRVSDRSALSSEKLNSAVGFVILVCLLATASLSEAAPPVFITTPPAVSGVTTSAQGSPSVSTDLNQTALTQIISQLNQHDSQINAASAQTFAQPTLFERSHITAIRRSK